MKKSLFALLLVALALTVLFMLCGCDTPRVPETIHVHLPADAVRENEIPATCAAEGSYDEVVYCSTCDEELSRTDVIIDILPHTPSPSVKENEVASTCTERGSYDEVTYCSACEAETERRSVKLFKLPHELENNKCTNCNKKASSGLAFTYTDDYTAIVTGIGSCKDTEIIIPILAPNGYRVKDIQECAFKNSGITSVSIPDGIIFLGNEAFMGCTELREVVFPETITYFGSSVFEGCTSLTEVLLPANMSFVENAMFYNCKSLERVVFAEGSKTTDLFARAFKNCESLREIVLPDGLKRITYQAFHGCASLTSLTIPKSVEWIDDSGVFGGCYRLIEVINESSLDIRAGSGASSDVVPYALYVHSGVSKVFEDGDGFVFFRDEGANYLIAYFGEMRDIRLPNSCDGENYEIHSYAFYASSKLTKVKVPYGVAAIGDYAFANCSGITSVSLPDTLKTVGAFAFRSCTALKVMDIPQSVELIGEGVLENCHSLTKLTVPFVGLNEKGEGTLHDLFEKAQYSHYDKVPDTLKTVVITGGSSIASFDFEYCDSIENILVPETLISIDYNAFRSCDSLKYNERDGILYLGNEDNPYVALISAEGATGELVINPKTTVIAARAFKESEITGITLPDNFKNIGKEAFSYCYGLTEINIPNGVTLIGESAFYCCISLSSVDIPDSVTKIEKYAFQSCSRITSVTIPEGVTEIGDGAFSRTDITSIEIPKSVKKLGYGAFCECDLLESVIIKNSELVMDNSVFESCPSLKSVTLPAGLASLGDYTFAYCTKLESITIPDGVKKIGSREFIYCINLKYVTLPDSIESIDAEAFKYCKSLTGIVIPDGVTAISDTTFAGCESLKEIVIPDGVTSIGAWAFADCTSLENVVIPEGVTSIGMRAFEDCTSLTSITIPDSVTSIDDQAFLGCESLTGVTFKNTGGWQVKTFDALNNLKEEVAITSSELANASVAAEYLTKTYCAYKCFWTRD